MSKSKKNNYTISDIARRDIDPLALRYLYMQTHYRQEMNFTWEGLSGAANALARLREEIRGAGPGENNIGCAEFEQQFQDAINDDINMPKALSIMWELLNSNYPKRAKVASLLRMDKVLGLDLESVVSEETKELLVPQSVMELVKEREEMRKQKRFHLADQLRNKIKKLGYDIKDEKRGTKIIPG